MKKSIFILVSVLVLAGFFGVSCGRGDRFVSTMAESDDSLASRSTVDDDSCIEVRDKNGKLRRFYVKQTDDMLWELWVDDKRIDDVLIEGEGVPEMTAFPSPDGRYVYVVTDILANGTPFSCFVYQINTQSLRTKLIDNGAGFYKTSDGFCIIVPRCINPDAANNAEMRYRIHDEFYGFDGKKKRIGKERELM